MDIKRIESVHEIILSRRRRESNPPSLLQVIEINNEIFNRFLLETVWKPFSKDGSKENFLKNI